MATDPKRLQIINRIVTVLGAIAAGANYHYTPRQVAKGFVSEPRGFPVYEVVTGPGGDIRDHSDFQAEETFTVSVLGTVQDAQDVATKLERALKDVRRAISRDLRPEAGAGSLRTLADWAGFDGQADVNYDFDGKGFFAAFSQRIKFTLSGELGEI